MKITNKKWLWVCDILEDLERQSDRLDDAINGLLIPPESPLLDPQYRTQGDLVLTLSFLIHDEWNYLSWYVYECDFGFDPKKAGCEGDLKLIDSTRRLRWFLELDCDSYTAPRWKFE